MGLPLADLAEQNRGARVSFADLAQQPRRLLDSPCWTGLTGGGRTYSAYCLNVERLVPWRTLTGRQHFYLDHPGLHRLRRDAAHLQAEAGGGEGPRPRRPTDAAP